MFDRYTHLAKAVYIVGSTSRKIIQASSNNIPKNDLFDYVKKAGNDLINSFDVELEIKGLENMLDEPAIICANHTSALDMPVLVMLPGRQYFAAKKELYNFPILGKAMNLVGLPMIDRKKRMEAIRSLKKGAESMKDMYQEGNPAYLAVFPEGTRNNSGNYDLLDFKRGPFYLSSDHDLPIIPVSIYGGLEMLPKKSKKVIPGKIELRVMEAVRPPKDSYGKKKKIVDILNETKEKIEKGLDQSSKAI